MNKIIICSPRMFRLSCFHASAFSAKQRKTVQLSPELLQDTPGVCLQTQVLNNHNFPLVSDLSSAMVERSSNENPADHATDSCVVEFDGGTGSKYSVDHDVLSHRTVSIKKSRSLGSCLDMKGSVSDNAYEDDVDQQFHSEGLNDMYGSLVPNISKDPGMGLADQFEEAFASGSFLENLDVVNHDSVYIFEGAQESGKLGHVNHDGQIYFEDKSGGYALQSPQVIVKSSSLPNIGSPSCSFSLPLPHSRSAEDLHVLDSRRKGTLVHDKSHLLEHHEDNNLVCNEVGKNDSENYVDYSCDNGNSVGFTKDWAVPVGDERTLHTANARDNYFQQDESSSKDFTKRRILDWVTDLQQCDNLEVSSELSAPDSYEPARYDNSLDVFHARREEGKVNTPGMEAVKKYISSLTPSATSAQLVNHGLVVIPLLSAFSSLRALNLSGNAIVRITAGALPRGLHALNLSKNNISVIEGLRELTRLRVLDLSYNRILRIGHGLASCFSLKELYLAGNKISEVEGLHRLLKLNVLDLRFNKISTTKCLGQLAANYLSLQVIGLEGNPAQKNVGDEHLKKYLQGLLPHLTYFNKQPVKVGGLKDTAERVGRLGIGTHPSDHGLKPELKHMRKGTSSSIHGRRSQPTASSKPSSSRHLRAPSGGSKPPTQHINLHELTNKFLNLKSDSSVRKSRSVGNLGVL